MTEPSNPPQDILSTEETNLLDKFRQLNPEYQSAMGNVIRVMVETLQVKETLPKDGGSKVVHQCANPTGFPLSVLPDMDIDELTLIPDVLTRSAVWQVLHALDQCNQHLSTMVDAICKLHLPEPALTEWGRIAGPLEEMQAAHQQLSAEVAALVNQNAPPTVTTVEDMLHQTLQNSGFCCAERVDNYVTEGAGPAIAFCQRQIPGFDPAWLTLAGSAKLRKESRVDSAAGGA